eukprot:4493249-Pleurochrysis_carterae.AAC.2
MCGYFTRGSDAYSGRVRLKPDSTHSVHPRGQDKAGCTASCSQAFRRLRIAGLCALFCFVALECPRTVHYTQRLLECDMLHSRVARTHLCAREVAAIAKLSSAHYPEPSTTMMTNCNGQRVVFYS